MRLLLYIGNELIDHIPLEKDLISLPGYVKIKTTELKKKNCQQLKDSELTPEFFIGPLNQIDNLIASISNEHKLIA
jgi:hypothetical protein